MSEQKLISPLLDGFVMGDPMSNHDGVRCCPAMKENSDEKYIVKIISVPASQRQLDALLLTGAYQDAASATEYFKELADGIVQEAELLQQLAKLEGFLAYDGWQVVPMEDNKLGYEIYLIGSYKRSLEKHLRRNTMTHLGAVNLGLDLCAALSILRRAGYMYVDLKPANIYLSGEREFRIGDLGFAKLSSLKFSSLPSKYRSCYTPPELHDALATLNPTADIYAVGMILYQIYNNGVLPYENQAPAKALPAPMNADYEMAEIIQKAIDPNPRKRWQTPIEMGKALVSYMQRNTINDVPIVPPAIPQPTPVPVPEETVSDIEPVEVAIPIPLDEENESTVVDDFPEKKEPADSPKELSEELSFMSEMVSDETAPDEKDGNDLDTEMSEEVNSMLAQADELLMHEIPDPVTVPEPKEPPQENEEESNAEDEDEDEIGAMINSANPVSFDNDDDEDEEYFAENQHHHRKGRSWVKALITIMILVLLGGTGYYYYQNFYLLEIDNLYIKAEADSIHVKVITDVDETLLTVVCTDTYGNTKQEALVDGEAVFSDLNPDTQYKITIESEGFHQLDGSYFGSCSTEKQTNIIDFTAKTGTEDGSVILNFTVEGPETQDWMVEYVAEGEETKSVSFTGHMVAINGLTVGKVYTFTLVPSPGSEQWVVGNDSLEFTASKIVVAQNLTIVSCEDGVLTAKWDVPYDAAVESWTVRCYSEDGYDETATVTNAAVQFDGISTDKAYTVEVTASGMSQNARAYVSANPNTITGIQVDDSDPDVLTVSWTFEGNAPEGGWLLMYSMDGSESPDAIRCESTSGTIETRVPKASYALTIQAADGSTVFGNQLRYVCPEAESFDKFSLPADQIQASLCPTPEKENWTYADVAEDDYTTTYAPGDKVSFVLYAAKKFYTNNEDIEIMYVIRNAEGSVLPELLNTETRNWRSMWYNRYASLDIPQMPTANGEYTIEVYFNNAFVLSKNFTITG